MCLSTVLSVFSSEAYAERQAVIFIECEHEDLADASIFELVTVWVTNANLGASYDTLHWLVNKDATRDNFMASMITAVNESPSVDLYLIAHGGTEYVWGHNDTRITSDDILALGTFENMDHLRFVYNGSCYGYDQTDEYRTIGAMSTIGNIELSTNEVFYPAFTNHFRKRTGHGGEDISKPLYEAVRIAKEATIAVNVPMNFEINGDKEVKMTTPR